MKTRLQYGLVRLGILLVFGILVCLPSTAFAASAHTTHALASNCSGTYWNLDDETYINTNGQSNHGQTVIYTWFLSLSSLHNCGSGSYAGRAADEICLTVPAGTGWPNVRLYNEWYTNSNFINEATPYFQINNYTGGTYCSYSGSWIVPQGSSALIVGQAQANDGSYPFGEEYLGPRYEY